MPRTTHRRDELYDYAVLMPVYNEADTFHSVMESLRHHYHGEVIVVDDGSTDGTVERVAERDDVLLVRHPENLGYGKSLIDGIVFARFTGIEYLVTMDCDGQHEPKHIPAFFQEVVHGDADIVSGSRYLPDSPALGAVPPDRREVNERITAEVNRVTGWALTDAFCGFKAYKLAKLDGMALTEDGYGMPMELWAKAWKTGLTVKELPVERIYFDNDRRFGQDLDDPAKRMEYYLRVWADALGGSDA